MNCSHENNGSFQNELCEVSDLQDNSHWTQFPKASWQVCYIWGSILLVIGLFGISGNALVLFVFTKFRRLRGPFSCFIINLATADFCSSVVHFMSVTSCFCQRWLFGTIGCRFYACSIGLFGLVSIVTLSTIAVERYIVITSKPFSGSWKITTYGARKVCFAVWLYCSAMVLPPLFGWSSYGPEGFMTSCSWDYLSRNPWNRSYYIYLLTLGFIIPVTVITYCYIFILAAIVAHSREMESVKSTGGTQPVSLTYSLSRGVAYCMNPSADPARAQVITWTNSSAVRTAEIILMLILLFIVAWLPYAVVTMIGQFGDAQLITPWVAALPGLFAKTSVLYNPIVYGLSHPHFRSSLRQYMSSCATGSHSVVGGPTSVVSHHQRNPSRRVTSSPTAFEMHSPLRRKYSTTSCRDGIGSVRIKGSQDTIQCSGERGKLHVNNFSFNETSHLRCPSSKSLKLSVETSDGYSPAHRDVIRLKSHEPLGSPV